MGHAFGILMAHVGTLRTCGAPAPLTLGVRPLFGWSLEAFSGRVLRHRAPRSARHAGMAWLASVASWLISQLASLQAWR